LNYLIQTLGATGIRVSELRFITVAAVRRGIVDISMKGKERTIIIPRALCVLLKKYIGEQKIKKGPLFITRSGRPVDRSNVHHALKKLCTKAKVDPQKVFPHNFRHLFARCFYAVHKDIGRLADLLGHSSIETTRIYIAVSSQRFDKIFLKMKMIDQSAQGL
ncbi:MAG: tyrosine-type recombinase/integrase, partial [Eubacteriaceae bacterium]|nr:tyrosine-type recombinase/integrase [Eubacteriaceae bacterium]